MGKKGLRWKTVMAVGLTVCGIWAGASQAHAYSANLKPYTDVLQEDWSAQYVYFLSSLGIINGYNDQTYHPNDNVTREAFIKLLVTGAKLQSPSVAGGAGQPRPAADVAQDRWSYPFIQTAGEYGLIQFMLRDDLLQPDRNITREEAASLIGGLLLQSETEQFRDEWTKTGWRQESGKMGFVDAGKLDEALSPRLYYAAHMNIIVGDDNKKFRPGDPLTRKEAAAVIYRLMQRSMERTDIHYNGFYAINSYPNLDKAGLLDRIYTGWSSLKYSAAGQAELTMASGDYKLPLGWEEVIAQLDEKRVARDLMVFNNNPAELTGFLNDEQAKQSFISGLMKVLEDDRFGYTGVCIDFEGLKDEAAGIPYAEFLQRLKASLGDRSLTVAVPPTFYYKGYDMERIGKQADSVVLMAYDFTDWNSRLPSAPLPLVNETVVEALKHVPSGKLILGISKQANQWTDFGGNVDRAMPDSAKVEARLRQQGTKAEFSLPYFLTHIRFQDDRGSHEIWYEDERSIEEKIELAQFYGLQGVSLWHMGSLTQSDWSEIAVRQSAKDEE